ncbi:PREDICTED: putative UPF0481 protein At3g02645 [Erythranthe guttata]|uniref:putative UPF0481 protein At3g02645 n=1 Tax=Erythranthe guttata TaxID=4155 RepID=UPI00064E0B77|nr:PREDICTED: putative UPF0481 protein At3g02645 [Erythranthe guttata]|eukprot:XP_012836340.1 PREDICTED: putative UPF0481 protein At3g02645 [Erythranthe guttata]
MNFAPQNISGECHHHGARYCVFTVPKSLKESKPDAYAPQHLGLGPYHHPPHPYIPKQFPLKLAVVEKYIARPQELTKIRKMVEAALVRSDRLIRSCYDKYLDRDIKFLAWILAIDGLFLLHFLINYSPNQDPEMETLAPDILMLENQIPVVLLRVIQDTLESESCVPDDKYLLFDKFQVFCQNHSPLKLSNNPMIVRNVDKVHLLDHMYYSILNNVTTLGAISTQKNIPVLPVLLMSETGRVKFTLASGGIRAVKFDKEKKKFYLPVIRVNAASHVILRNLLAYEAALAKPGSTILELAQYVDLMCRLVENPEDVAILRKAEIIVSELRDEEVANFFNGLKRDKKKDLCASFKKIKS